jgi:heme-degrading monooxygenase HmoA
MKTTPTLPEDSKVFPLPYYVVIFTSNLSQQAQKVQPNYAEVAKKMLEIAKKEDGFLGMDSARSELGITVSYWTTLEAIQAWKSHSDHRFAQIMGKERFYESYEVRIAKVERHYSFHPSIQE